MKYLCRLLMILGFGAGLAIAQTGMQPSPTTPPTLPSQQQPGGQHLPDESTGQASTPSTTAITKAESDIQTALRRQMPASADSVTVSLTDDNKIQLTGTVTSETEKNQVEQVARSAAPDLKIVNKLMVANVPSNPTPPKSNVEGTTNPEGKTGTEKSAQPTPNKPIPPRGSNFMAQTGTSPQYPSSSPNAGAQSGTNPSSQQPSQQPDKQSNAANTNTSDVQGNIQKALQQDPTLAGANISATVNGNKVELTGTVASKEQKKTAKQIAETNAGVMKVADHLKVEHSKAGKDNAAPQKH
jgi:osmotically-inducible protein OsmY